jgi:hypothetical protein
MFELKPLTREALPRAIEKAERYRLLNEPGEAESICLDVLQLEPDDQRALVMLLLVLTDQFDDYGADPRRALELLPRLAGEYERAYYAGIVAERRGKAHFKRGGPGAGFAAYEGLREAMDWYEKAEHVRPAGNDDAILRWNACARLLMSQPSIQPLPRETAEAPLE